MSGLRPCRSLEPTSMFPGSGHHECRTAGRNRATRRRLIGVQTQPLEGRRHPPGSDSHTSGRTTSKEADQSVIGSPWRPSMMLPVKTSPSWPGERSSNASAMASLRMVVASPAWMWIGRSERTRAPHGSSTVCRSGSGPASQPWRTRLTIYSPSRTRRVRAQARRVLSFVGHAPSRPRLPRSRRSAPPARASFQ